MNTFITCLKVVKNYTGMKLLFALTVIAWVYLFVKEKNKTMRVIFVYMPLIVMAAVVCPVTYWMFEFTHLDTAIYYRILWVIPMAMITVYAIVKVSSKSTLTRVIALIVSVGLFALCGKCIYFSDRMYKAENEYAIPQDPILVVDRIRKEAPDRQRITVLCPSILTLYVRQYDADICMPYGREMFDINNNYSIPIFEEFEQSDPICMKSLLEQSRQFEVEYIVFYAGSNTDVDPTEAGLKYVDTIGNYIIYRDSHMTALIDEWSKYYEE